MSESCAERVMRYRAERDLAYAELETEKARNAVAYRTNKAAQARIAELLQEIERLREALFKALADDEEMRGEGHHGLDCPDNLATPNACRAIPCWVEEARQIRAALTAREK